jgi:hypothetical protein
LSLNPCGRDTHALVRRFVISSLEVTIDKCAFASAGYPIYSHFTTKHQSKQGAFNYGGTNSTGQVPKLINNIGLIDAATPQSAYTKPSFEDPTQQWDLVFSDEFNVDGRTFWPGDDPYWEAVDLDYWQTVSALVPAMRSVPTSASGRLGMVRSEAGLYKEWVPLAHHRQCVADQQSQHELHFRHGTVRSLASLVNVNFLPTDSVMVSIRNNVPSTFRRRCSRIGTSYALPEAWLKVSRILFLTKSL